MTSSECFFHCGKDDPLCTGGKARIESVISSSIARNDTYHVELNQQLQNDPNLKITFHKNCISTYTSSTHINRYLKRMGSSISPSEAPLPKLRSNYPTFDFRSQCLICSQACLPKDPKHPGRWRKVVICRTVDMKQKFLQVCDERGDHIADGVRVRVNAAITDLHAADAQYHFECYTSFVSKRNIAAATSTSENQEPNHTELAFKYVVDTLQDNPAKMWNSIEIYEVYRSFLNSAEGSSTPICTNINFQQRKSDNADDTGRDSNRNDRALLIRRLEKHLGHSLIVLRVNGCASIICFRKYLPTTLKLVEANDNDEVTELATNIIAEVNENSLKSTKSYNLDDFKLEKVTESTNERLVYFISKLVSKGTVTKKSLSLTQSIQALITKSYNQTTLGLAVKIHHRFGSREIIDLLYDHGYVASYDEVRRYRKSAAKMTGEEDFTFRGLLNDGGLISSWCDNFDLQVYTPNGCRETHSMAVEFTQHVNEAQDHLSAGIDIPRISIKDMNSLKTSEMSSAKLVHFDGHKKPLPPQVISHLGPPFEHVSKTAANVRSALENDMRWMVSVVQSSGDDTPTSDWSGTMASLAKERGEVPGVATQFVFGPLIDSPPAHPDTVLTTLTFIEEFMKQHNKEYINICADMQLYKVIQQIKWSNLTRWGNLVVRPGGMHTLMSFVGCIGTLMNSSGLEELLNVAFKGVSHMLNGKAWPKAVRGFRMVLIALLEPLLVADNTTVAELTEELNQARESRTGRLWVDCFITPLVIINLYIRAEREGNWLLHMYALKRMIPFFFAAGHWNYARYIAWHVLEMSTSLPDFILAAFLRGEHACRHHTGVWNSVFLDQFGEQTYIRYGKSKGGLVGKSLSSEQVSEWILSHHLCNTLSLLIDSMFDKSSDVSSAQTSVHKEEGKNRRKLDAVDRRKIIEALKKHTNPVIAQQDEPLSNIINGRIAPEEVNVHDALAIGQEMAAQFIADLPCGFHNPLKKKVVTMDAIKKRVKVGDAIIYNMEQLYGRLLVISQSRDIKLSEVFKYELAPVPSSIFDEYGDMRKGSKAVLVQKLAVFAMSPLAPVDAELIDGNEAIYHTLWPRNSTLKAFADNFISSFERVHTTCIIFDRYDKHSTKSHERQRRAKGVKSHEYVLNSNTILPAKDIIMRSDMNKRALIQYLCDANKTNPQLHLIGDDSEYHHEEADVKIISYLLKLSSQRKHIQILADDTDIFVLLVFFFWVYKPAAQVSMRKYDGKVIDIKATALKLGNKCIDLLAVHALSGCDTVSYPFGKGKVSALNLLLKLDLHLKVFTEPNAEEVDWMKAGMNFLSYLYCGKENESLNSLRFTLFSKKKDPPKIKSLPPTDKSAIEHVKRARLQVLIWRAADQNDPPSTNLSMFGWKIEEDIPVPVHGTVVAPKELLELVACGCKSVSPCSRANCSCQSAGVSCTTYCKCEAKEQCANVHTKKDEHAVETDEEEELDEPLAEKD